MWIIHRLASFKLEKHRLLTNLGFFFLVMCLSFKLFKIFLMVKLLTLENQILHQIQYFFVVFLVSAPIINAMQIHVTSHCYTTNRLAWLASLLLHLKKKKLEYIWLGSDWSLFCEYTPAETESVSHTGKDICKELNCYGLLCKCVSRHFIINWNLTS